MLNTNVGKHICHFFFNFILGINSIQTAPKRTVARHRPIPTRKAIKSPIANTSSAECDTKRSMQLGIWRHGLSFKCTCSSLWGPGQAPPLSEAQHSKLCCCPFQLRTGLANRTERPLDTFILLVLPFCLPLPF